MNDDERTFSKSEIRERRREVSQLLALRQRQLDALAKMADAADELEQVEREIAALTAGERRLGQPAEIVSREPVTTGQRALTVLKNHPDAWLAVRDVLAGMIERGWVAPERPEDTDLALQTLRHSLRRLALRHDDVERDESGPAFTYRYHRRASR